MSLSQRIVNKICSALVQHIKLHAMLHWHDFRDAMMASHVLGSYLRSATVVKVSVQGNSFQFALSFLSNKFLTAIDYIILYKDQCLNNLKYAP